MTLGIAGNVLCFSGGKDSTGLGLAMMERGETIAGILVTPTGNEPLAVWEHWDRVASMIGAPIVRPAAPTLLGLIDHHGALPNFRQRWCTRQIKIVPAIAWAKANPEATLCVGIRADEPAREGIISTSVRERFPLREYGMGLPEVRAIIAKHGLVVPSRTDCELCYHQRIGEWYELWRDHPDRFAVGVGLEEKHGHTFRTRGRDSWPVPLRDLGEAFAVKAPQRSLDMLARDRADDGVCRVCSL